MSTQTALETAFIGAGDPSGDLLSSLVLDSSRRFLPSLTWWGYGGPYLAESGVKLLDRLERFGTSGLVEAAGRLPRNAMLLASVVDALGRLPTRLGVLVDYPDLHFLLGPAMRRAGVRIVYLLPPQVWAWRRGRLRFMRTFVDAVAVGFPFEVGIYRDVGIRADFVGHPLCMLEPYRRIASRPRTSGGRPVVAFLPGSRPHEVARVLPAMHGAALILRRRLPDVICRLAPGPTVDPVLVDRILGAGGREIFDAVPHPPPAARTTTAAVALSGASAAVVQAGTATLEAALLGVPSLVVARLSRTSWRIARRFVRVDHVALPSIVLGRAVFPERLQDEVEPRGIADDVERLVADDHARSLISDASGELHGLLKVPDGGLRFAELALGASGV